MTIRVTEGSQSTTSPVRETLVSLLPRTAQQAQTPQRLADASAQLVKLALGDSAIQWRAELPKAPLPLWLEDALLLDIIPGAAAQLGAQWTADTLSFVDVSIASARLQETVRRLGLRASRAAKTPVVPVILPPWEQHSLAAALAAHRVCRAGRRAVLLTGLGPERLARLPIVQSAPALLICVTAQERDSRLKQFIRQMREGVHHAVPIVAGGPAFVTPYIDNRASTCASCFANDPVAALQVCGIDLSDITRGSPKAESEGGLNELRF